MQKRPRICCLLYLACIRRISFLCCTTFTRRCFKSCNSYKRNSPSPCKTGAFKLACFCWYPLDVILRDSGQGWRHIHRDSVMGYLSRRVLCHVLEMCPVASCLRNVQVCCSVLWCVAVLCCVLWCVVVCCSVVQCVAVLCSVLWCVAVCFSVFQCVAVCCSVLQCCVVCCGV